MTKGRDLFKMVEAFKQGLKIIRLYQINAWEDKNNWKLKLEQAIKKYASSKIIFIDYNNLYEKHINDSINSGISRDNIEIINEFKINININ